jgi:2-haloacid dehalogenase
MSITLAFDVYGTLIDTQGVVFKLTELVGGKAYEFSRTWRDKQLEYLFRRGLMQDYQDFSVCTSDALNYTCDYLGVSLSSEQKNELLQSYRTLPAFGDVEEGLLQLKSLGFRLYAFSNGTKDVVEGLLVAASIREYFIGIVSVDEIKSFKPAPAVYAHFIRSTGASSDATWLISSNPFDVIGAASTGIKSVWVKRSEGAIFDPWGIEPTITVKNINDLSEAIEDLQSAD